ncbi:type I-B CRISPR-associated protein Cas8b1/Cst1 [Microscilla marina]|nr:type I-B CRISPR-associated protein Cas8b1/Cst1 [Microscilla marina]
MKKTIENIAYKWLTKPTGDPFVDVGGVVMDYFARLHPGKDVLGLIESMTDIYVNNWSGKLNAFFLNSTITQPAFKGQKKIDETLKYFKELIQDKRAFQEGYCRITGRKTKLFYAGRDNHILSGSGTFINFHSAFESGLTLSKEVLIRIFFVPFGLLQVSDKIALIQSNDLEVSKYFVLKNCQENIQGIATGASEGVLKSSLKNPASALFGFIDDCVSDLKTVVDDRSKLKDIAFNIYHFTNFGASPEVQLYHLHSTAFRFYLTCLNPRYRDDWQGFVSAHYHNSKFKNIKFNRTSAVWEDKTKVAKYGEYKNWSNSIYNKLLLNQPILAEILNWSKKYPFNFKIVEIYQTHIRNMDKHTLNKIKELADFVIRQKEEDKIKRTITRLRGCKSTHEVRQVLLKWVGQHYQNGEQTPLITLEEYTQYLFPEGINWREIRDLLLIGIYQKLHEHQMQIALESSEGDKEEETETINQ